MENPIDRLLREHVSIMEEVARLRRALLDLEARGDEAVPECLPVLRDVGRMMATTLEAHARREDDALFPAVEEALGGPAGPTMVMRAEHQDIHARAATFRRVLRELETVEHPAIVAGGAALRAQAAAPSGAAALRATAAEVVRRLDDHFAKEEEILFPLARSILTDAQLAEVARAMQALDG